MQSNDFNNLIKSIPEVFRERVSQHWGSYIASCKDLQEAIPTADTFKQDVCKVWALSDFVAENCIRDPAMLNGLFISSDILRDYAIDEYVEKLVPLLLTVSTEDELGVVLRRFRRREMTRIIWRDLAGQANLLVTIRELSALADACIDQTAKILDAWQCQQLGTPMPDNGIPQHLIVLGLGKLGGEELNLSSDVDLIFSYPSPGETQGVAHPVTHEEFFHRLGQKLIHILNMVTAESFVFRVDMRLRPLGAIGPLVMPFNAMENYYLEQGRDWERYALIKARLVSGNSVTASRLMNILKPFIYRRYLDYSALESLRQMHNMIIQETKNKKLQGHVKLGPGGIREIEFIAQTFQLIRGGQEPRLQDRRIFPILNMLAEMKFLPEEAVKELLSAYVFLRNVEHRLQAVGDRQTHQLPEDDYNKFRLAYSMGYSDWLMFENELNKHRVNVQRHFQRLVAKPELEVPLSTTPSLQHETEELWLGQGAEQNALTLLQEMGFSDSEAALKIVNNFRGSRRLHNLSELGRARLNLLMPQLLMLIGKAEQPLITLKRLIEVLESIMRRSTYMVLLLENPKALNNLVELCSISPWLTDQLARYPMLLGELLESSRLYAPLNLATLETTLSQALAVLPEDDLEHQMECLRRFKLVHLFRVAAMDVTGVLPLMRVSDHLTNIAEVILRHTQRLAWLHLVKRHGPPPNIDDENNFAIIAYGKLGGIELGYGSDLDLVFLYDVLKTGSAEQQYTVGENPIPLDVFYIRLGQRMINMLETRTTSGTLYEVDTRLRPSGESGLLVTSMDTFIDYQRKHAWTWEHQALVRARMINGTKNLIQRFDVAREEILSMPRNPEKLRQEVREMRQRMRDATKLPPTGLFDLKHGYGGITDIEFIAQYGVLRWANQHPAVMVYPDVIRIVESFAAEGLLSVAEIRLLSDAYRAYRAMVHRLNLQNQPAHVPDNQFRSYREGIQALWQKLLEKP